MVNGGRACSCLPPSPSSANGCSDMTPIVSLVSVAAPSEASVGRISRHGRLLCGVWHSPSVFASHNIPVVRAAGSDVPGRGRPRRRAGQGPRVLSSAWRSRAVVERIFCRSTLVGPVTDGTVLNRGPPILVGRRDRTASIELSGWYSSDTRNDAPHRATTLPGPSMLATAEAGRCRARSTRTEWQ